MSVTPMVPPSAPVPAPAGPAQSAPAPAPADPGQSAPVPAPADPGQASPAPAPADPGQSSPAPGFLASALALGREKAGLLQLNREQAGQLGQLQAEVSRLTAENSKLAAENASHIADRAALQSAFDAMEAGQSTVSGGVVQALASLNVPREALPALVPPGQSAPENLFEQFRSERDPLRKAELARKLKLSAA